MTSGSLPVGWLRVSVGDVTAISRSKASPREAAGKSYIGLENIERDSHRLTGLGDSSKINSIKSSFQAGNLLYGRLRPNLNKSTIPDFDGVCSTDIVVFKSTALLDARYLLQVLSTEKFLAYSTSKAKGVNLPRLSISDLLAYEIALPPIEEQMEILDALETKLRQIEVTRRRLNELERVIQSLPMRVIERAVAAEPLRSAPARQEEARDVEAWPVKQMRSVGEITLGKKRSLINHQGPNMRPYLRVANVLEARIDTFDVMSMHFPMQEFETYRLVDGDILINEGQSLELVGRAAMFRGEIEGCCFTNTLIRFRPYPGVEPEFALLVFRHYLHTGVFAAAAKITTNLAHLGLARFSDLPFPTPSLEEQRDRALWASSRLQDLEALRLNIARLTRMTTRLATAFRDDALAGNLVQSNGQYDVADRLQEAMTLATRRAGEIPLPPKSMGATRTMPISILKALAQSPNPRLTGQELFDRAGYPDDASTEVIERFFLELRDALVAGAVLRHEDEGDDRFQLASPGAAA